MGLSIVLLVIVAAYFIAFKLNGRIWPYLRRVYSLLGTRR